MKYKVILVDDEEEVLQSIRRNLEWESYGFEVVETFSNGRDVMDFLEMHEVDLIITDIRMPFMDGIELSKNINERYPQTKVIILSGYGDFNYAKEAMSYRVMDYILKPINAKEMGEVLLRARESLRLQMEKSRNIEHLQEQYLKHLPLLRENFLYSNVSGNVMEHHLLEELGYCDVTVQNASGWMAVLVEPEQSECGKESRIDEQYFPVYIRYLTEKRFAKHNNYSIFYHCRGVCIIFGLKQPEHMREILLCLDGIVKEIKRVMNFDVVVGAGRRKHSLLQLKDSYEEAKEAISYLKITKTYGVVSIEDIDFLDHECEIFYKNWRKELFTVVKFGSYDDIRTAVNRINEQVTEQKVSVNVCQTWLIGELNAMYTSVKPYTETDHIKIQDQYEDMDSLFQWFMEKCFLLNECLTKERANRDQKMIETVQRCVHKELENPDITVEWAAQKAGLTSVCLSRLFQKQTGETFTEYLTRVRLEEAVRLLDVTEEKIYEIAEKTGYSDVGYFSYMFQRTYGMSPIQRRRLNKQEQG